MLSSSESSSSDEEIPRPRIYHERETPFGDLDDVDFKMRFRFEKATVRQILSLIEPDLTPVDNRNSPISAMNQLLITLRYYATGTFQLCIGDTFNISQPTISRCIKKVSHHLALLRPHFVTMPQNRNDVVKVTNDFYSVARFPGVLGAVDCTHIKIQSPGGENAEVFRNRKGWFSYNVQMVCDAHMKFMDVVVRWPGSTHDSTIFNNSILRARLETNSYPNKHLLGDSGYACKRYLLTPVLNPQNNSAELYNRSHIKTRNVIERAFGVLKRRFPVLSVGIRVKAENVIPIIVATVVLHNIALDLNDEPPLEDPNVVLDDEFNFLPEIIGAENYAVRNAIIEHYFTP